MKLTKNFSLSEFEHSQTATYHDIDNEAPPEAVENMKALCVNILQPLRDAHGSVHISSGYRCPELNKRIGGSRTSDHQYGRAADIKVSGLSPFEVVEVIKDSGVPFKQVINEYNRWVHISFDANNNKGQVLSAVKEGGRTVYKSGNHG